MVFQNIEILGEYKMKQQTVTRDFENYCEEIVKKYDIPGFAVGLAKNGDSFYEKGYGYRNVKNELPLSSDTVFGIGSVTKSFTCVAILQLQEAGKLSVHDPVVKYLPEYKTPNEVYAKETTIHHFMTHTAGLPPLPSLYGAMKKTMANDPKIENENTENQSKENPFDKIEAIDTYEQLMEFIGKQSFSLLGAPGSEFSYSNDAFALLGCIIERVSGIPYEQYMKEYVLEPAGMKHTVFHLEELSNHDDVAVLYNSYQKENKTVVFESNNPWDAPAMRSSGFLKSTINDMLKYTEIFRNNGKVGNVQILSPGSVELMTTPYIECEKGRYYGYGLMITPDYFGYKLVEHGGAIKGVAAQMNIIPKLGLTGVSFTNLGGVPSTKLLFSAFADYLGKGIHESHITLKEIELSQEEMNEYLGTFVSGEGMKLDIKLEDGELQFVSAELPPMSMKPLGNDIFSIYFRETTTTVRFIRNSDGKIHRIAFGFRQIQKVE